MFSKQGPCFGTHFGMHFEFHCILENTLVQNTFKNMFQNRGLILKTQYGAKTSAIDCAMKKSTRRQAIALVAYL